MLQFIKNLVQTFNISNFKTQVAVLTFNTTITIFTELTAEKEIFNFVMRSLQYLTPEGLAFTHLALNTAYSVFANSSREIISTKTLVLLTDSSCNNNKQCPQPVENVAQKLNEAGIHIFAMCLSKASEKEMSAIGSLPGNRYIRINQFSYLKNSAFASDIKHLICQGISYVLLYLLTFSLRSY